MHTALRCESTRLVEIPAQNILQTTLHDLRDTWKGKSLRESGFIIDEHGLKFGTTRPLSVKILKVKLRGKTPVRHTTGPFSRLSTEGVKWGSRGIWEFQNSTRLEAA
jgi:hypothetical protein